MVLAKKKTPPTHPAMRIFKTPYLGDHVQQVGIYFFSATGFQKNWSRRPLKQWIKKWLRMTGFCFQKVWDIAFDRFFYGAQFENGKKVVPEFSTYQIRVCFWAKSFFFDFFEKTFCSETSPDLMGWKFRNDFFSVFKLSTIKKSIECDVPELLEAKCVHSKSFLHMH